MQYLITFLEGIISFISPCMLPMLPVYLIYFAGSSEDGKKKRTIINSIMFVLGFTAIFTLMGVFAGSIGVMLKRHQMIVNIVCGIIVVIFGLNYMGAIKLPELKRREGKGRPNINNAFSAFLFGMIYSINLTPCVGAFLGSALMMAASGGSSGETALKGAVLLLCYSLGLGIPFVISAVLLSELKGAFNFIKKHYGIINKICGAFLIVIGILMATGLMTRVLRMLT